MAMNKKGQMIMVGIMIAFMAFVVLIQFITPIKDQIVDARSADKLDCDNTSISTGSKTTCLLTDFYLPYFFGVGIFGALGYITLKKMGAV